MAMRITRDIKRPESVEIWVDDQSVEAYPGESVAAVLMVVGTESFYRTKLGAGRALYCNMGSCFECLVGISTANAASPKWVRACMTPVEAGMRIYTDRCFQENLRKDESK